MIIILIAGSQIEFPFVNFFKKEIELRSSMAYSSDDFRGTVNLMALGQSIHPHHRGVHIYVLTSMEQVNIARSIKWSQPEFY